MGSDDELAKTATAPGTPTALEGRLPDQPVTLERYVIESQLGAGGMGVVYRAFDPELERHVALKVLLDGSESVHRLLTEARAMARLAHPNVVTVYEIGTVNGRDFIAMELIDGASLADWLREARRSEREIIDAYLAAGRGLAAAHDQGMVHRDFKPHNVLRSKGGRIVVTDFGLAGDRADRTAAPATRNTPSALSGLTEPGTMLGTPAYMAPEQWAGGAVTPASDQFAFCVALWEALDGERPFKGDTPEVLRGAIERGPDELDISKIPRRLRAPLLRGLAIDPKERWPSMTALLAAIEPKRGRIVIAIAAVAAIAATTTIVVLARGNKPVQAVAGCEAPVIDPATVWTADNDAAVRKVQPTAANIFKTELANWNTHRAAACKLPDAPRRARLACLDRVLVRFAALRDARMLDPEALPDGLTRQIYSADVCALTSPPKLPERYSDTAVVGLALRAGYNLQDGFEAITEARRAAKNDSDPCAAGYFALLEVQKAPTVKNAEAARSAAERCDDSQLFGASLLNSISIQLQQVSTHDIAELLAEGERAVAAAAHPMLNSQWQSVLGDLAFDANELDEALEHFAAAYAGRTGIWDQAILTTRRLKVLAARSRPEDLEQIRREAAGWKAALIVHKVPSGAEIALDWYDAVAAWRLGDEDNAGARLIKIAEQLNHEVGDGKLEGVVVDEAGAPVPNAKVWAGVTFSDSFRGVIPSNELPSQRRDWQVATTNEHGEYSFDRRPQLGALVAEVDDRRSIAAPIEATRLVVHPTGSVRGHVRIDAPRSGELWVGVLPHGSAESYEIVAPVRPDGTFEMKRIPRGKALISVKRNEGSALAFAASQTIDITATPRELVLAAPSGRTLDVLVRSTSSLPIHQAVVHAFAGTVAPHTVRELEEMTTGIASSTVKARAVTKELAPSVHVKWKAGDLYARVTGVPAAGTLCVVGVQVDERDPKFLEKLDAQWASLETKCQPLAATDQIVVVEVPPMKRLE